MPFQLDHVIIAVNHLETAVEDFRQLGFTVIFGGEHASGTTHNALICFQDGTYIELLAPTGKPPRPGSVDFSVLLQQGEGLVGYALLADDLTATVASMRERGITISDPQPGKRLRRDGVELRWRTATVEGGFSPFLIQDDTPRHLRVPDDLAVTTHANGAVRLRAMELVAAEFSLADKEHYRKLLQTPPTYLYDNTHCDYQLGSAWFRVVVPSDEALNEELARNKATWHELIEKGLDYDPTDAIKQSTEAIRRRYRLWREHLERRKTPFYGLGVQAGRMADFRPRPLTVHLHGASIRFMVSLE